MSPPLDAPFGHDKAVAAGMRLQAADEEVHLLGQAKALAANLDEIARGDERVELTLEGCALFARNFEKLKEFADAGRMVHPIAHQRENLFRESMSLTIRP